MRWTDFSTSVRRTAAVRLQQTGQTCNDRVAPQDLFIFDEANALAPCEAIFNAHTFLLLLGFRTDPRAAVH